MRTWTWIFLFVTCVAPALCEPYPNIGPLGEWVSNGRWNLLVHSVAQAGTKEEMLQLPWSKGIVGAKGTEFADQVERLVFTRKERLVLLDVSLKNVGQASQDIGYDTPPWYVRCDDGQEVRNTGKISLDALRFLGTPFPKLRPVSSGGTVRGSMVFVLPAHTKPSLFFFKASPSTEKIAGRSESLVSRLGTKSEVKVKPLPPNRPEAAWKKNDKWAMRLVDLRLVSTPEAYRGLPWGERLQGEAREKHHSYVERTQFKTGGQVLLLGLEMKNLSAEKQIIGYEVPFWQVHGSDGTVLRLSGVYQQQIAWGLAGGMPKKARLNSQATASGIVGFFLPKGFKPVKLDFQVPGSLEKDYGSTGSLEFELL